MEHIPILRILSSRLPHFPEAAFNQGLQLETQTKASDSHCPWVILCFSVFASHCDYVHLRWGGQPVCVCVHACA